MGVDDLKSYSVKVGAGSGVIFQTMGSDDCTYILTANHNLFETNPDGNEVLLNTIDVFIHDHFQNAPLKFIIEEDENYFPHKHADIAILKIASLQGFEYIYSKINYSNIGNALVCGYPEYRRPKSLNEEYTNYQLRRYIDETEYMCRAQLTNDTTDKDEIIGLSGGGIMAIENGVISLYGIQSEMSSQMPNGQIGFVPIKYFDDIIGYLKNKEKLKPLLPMHMASFKYLDKEILKLEDAVFPPFKDKMDSAFEVIRNEININPYAVYKSSVFASIRMSSAQNPFSKELWEACLQYFIILSFLDKGEINIDTIESISTKEKLIYSDLEESWLHVVPKLIRNNLKSIEDGTTIIVSTKQVPHRNKRMSNSIIHNIYFANDAPRHVGSIDIYTTQQFKSLKEIIHISAFEHDCILSNQNNFDDLTILDIPQIIVRLKTYVNDFFAN